MDGERYARLVPSLSVLCEEYHMPPAAAFVLVRPALAYRVKVQTRSAKEAQR
jgi:hypothetical protein